MLDGSSEIGVDGLRSRYPHSFSEEQDAPGRRTALEIYEVDPLDGTGDFKKTYATDAVMSPTMLVAKLRRKSANVSFSVVGGIIFEIVHQYAIVSDDQRIGLFAINADGLIVEAPIRILRFWSWDH